MKFKFVALAIFLFAGQLAWAQQKSTPGAKPKSTSTQSTAVKPKPAPVKTTPKAKTATKVDIVGAAVSKDSKGAVVPLANKEPFKFYTDPDKELLTIEFTDPAFKNSEIAISDNDGKPVKQVQLEGNQTKINVNTQRWDNGIYVIVLTQHTTQQTIMQKIVLNR